MKFLNLLILIGAISTITGYCREKRCPCNTFLPRNQTGLINTSRTLRSLDELAQFYNLNKFSQLAHRIKLFEQLDKYDELTIFAPNDILISDLDIDDKTDEEIEKFFLGLIVQKRYFTISFPKSLTTISGEKIIPSTFEINTYADLKFKNGVLHIVGYIVDKCSLIR